MQALTCFDDQDRATPVGVVGFFPSLDAAENYRYEMKEENPHCEVTIFRHGYPRGTKLNREGER